MLATGGTSIFVRGDPTGIESGSIEQTRGDPGPGIVADHRSPTKQNRCVQGVPIEALGTERNRRVSSGCPAEAHDQSRVPRKAGPVDAPRWRRDASVIWLVGEAKVPTQPSS